ncbi:MAG: GDP-L-fucose synthase [Planctomycetota bacterium]|jgi:GDP-L-fucose synthase|nr:GDP-L-fucose synthase [Planctomycetota bacterium]
MDKGAKIYVAGHQGLAGSAIVRRLMAGGYANLPLKTHAELDLTRQAEVEAFLAREKPDYIFFAAGLVGGIAANQARRAEFIRQNIVMAANIVHSAWLAGVGRLLYLGSSCIYPRDCPQPMQEECLLTGPLEETNAPYALAKIAGLKLCESYNRQYGVEYVVAMPTNLYGPGDRYDLENCHVLPALIRKAHEAKVGGKAEMTVWGSGEPRREFLYADDLADACVFIMEHGDIRGGVLNVGSGKDLSVRELAGAVAAAVGFSGRLVFDPSRPDGTPRKLLDVEKLKTLGWEARTSLAAGLPATYGDFLAREVSGKGAS